MKACKVFILLGIILNLQQVRAQDPEVKVTSKVIVNDGYDHAELAVNPWGGSHGLFFGARVEYKGSDHLWSNGNAVYANGPGQYDYGAYSMGFIANGGPFAFYEGGRSTGAGNPISWNAVMAFSRGGNVGVGTTTPEAKFTVAGDIWGKTYLRVGTMPSATDGQFRILGQQGVGAVEAATNRTTYLYADQGYYGVSAYDYNVKAPIPLTVGFYDANTFINPNGGRVGIGTNIPSAKLDIHEGKVLGNTAGNHQLLYRVSGGSGNYIMKNLWLYRDADGDNWFTTRVHEGVSVDGSYLTPGVDTRTWWERDPWNNIQSWGHAGLTYMTINNGNVGIGTTNPQAKLAVNGDIFSKKVKVTQTGWADYVFEPSYKLPTLQEVEAFIKAHKHLPDVPSAKEVKENGLDLGNNQAVLLKKIEEQMLYLIQQQKEIEKLKAENIELKRLSVEFDQMRTILNKLVQQTNIIKQ